MQRSNAEGCATPRPIAVTIEPLGSLLNTERAGRPVTLQIEPVDQSDDFGFDWIDIELFLIFWPRRSASTIL